MSLFSIGKVIFSSLLKPPATVAFPAAPLEKAPIVRGHIEIEIEKCIYCGICSRKCPTGAITVNKGEKTWSISRFNCIVCNCCVESCPKKCLHMDKASTPASETCIKDVVKDARVPADA